MKKLIAIVLSSLLLIGAAVGGTLALASDEERTVNVYTAGNIDIALVNGDNDSLTLFPAVYDFESVSKDTAWSKPDGYYWDTNVLRNVYQKDLAVKNVGKNDAYIRVIVAYENPEIDDNKYFFEECVVLNEATAGITRTPLGNATIGGIEYALVSYQFNAAVAKGTEAIILRQLAIETATTSEQMASIDGAYSILVCAQAVQTDSVNTATTMLNEAFGDLTEKHPWEPTVSVEDTSTKFIVANDEALAETLNLIKTDSKYWNKDIEITLLENTYSKDHEINQYPQWNGVVGAGSSANNYAAGVPADAPHVNLTFIGVGNVVFTGNVTVNGFGNAGTEFSTAIATTEFVNVTFDAANSVEANGEDYIAMYVKAAANNVSFEGCTFRNATHIILGTKGADAVGAVAFDDCTFNDGGCLSGYYETLAVTNSTVTAAKNGFLNKSKSGDVTVDNCTVNAGKYFLRTSNSGINATVTNSTITLYESEGEANLVNFRGSDESITFTNCNLPATYASNGVDSDSTLTVRTDIDGITYEPNSTTGEQKLYRVPADYAETTVNVATGTTTIGGYAFAYNSNIETIVLPSTVTTLNDRAFRDTSAKTVKLNEGLTNISYQAFRNALNVESVVIPSTVTTISKEAFQNSGIKELVIPANVTTIEYGGLRDMKELTTVTIEGNVDIPVYAFRACTKLTTVIIEGDDVTFGGGSRGMIFTNKENGDGSNITIYVANETVKNRLLAADTAATDYGGYTIVVGLPSTNP